MDNYTTGFLLSLFFLGAAIAYLLSMVLPTIGMNIVLVVAVVIGIGWSLSSK